jgi:hypothetical protein
MIFVSQIKQKQKNGIGSVTHHILFYDSAPNMRSLSEKT